MIYANVTLQNLALKFKNVLKVICYLKWYLDGGFVIVNINPNPEDEDLIHELETDRGQLKAYLAGYFFNVHGGQVKRAPDGTQRLQCEDVNKHRCRAYIWALNGRATKRSETEHSHPPNATKFHRLRVRCFTVIHFDSLCLSSTHFDSFCLSLTILDSL